MHFALVLLVLSSPLATHAFSPQGTHAFSPQGTHALSPLATQALSLGDALRYRAGASKFAQTIENDAELSALVRSSFLTVFAPADSNSSHAYLRRRVTNDNSLQLSGDITFIQEFNTPPGKVQQTKDESANLDGATQAVVAHSWQYGDPTIITQNFFRRTIGNHTGERVTISSGLGKNVTIIRGDIPYDRGIIHVVNDFFTKPISLSATIDQTGNTQFASRLGRSNLTYLLDNTPSITAFVPSDAAFAALGNYTPTSAQIASQLSNHIVTNQVLYLPRLVHGARYQTRAGNEITVTVKSGRYFINDAELSQPDLILENGVAHIINKVLTPPATATSTATPTIVPYLGNGSKITISNPTVVTIIIIATAFLVYTSSILGV